MSDTARPLVRRPSRIGVPPNRDDEPVAPVPQPTVTKPAPAPARRSTRLGVPKLLDDEPVSEPARPPVQAAIVSPRDASIARAVATLRAIVSMSPPEPAVVLEGELPF